MKFLERLSNLYLPWKAEEDLAERNKSNDLYLDADNTCPEQNMAQLEASLQATFATQNSLIQAKYALIVEGKLRQQRKEYEATIQALKDASAEREAANQASTNEVVEVWKAKYQALENTVEVDRTTSTAKLAEREAMHQATVTTLQGQVATLQGQVATLQGQGATFEKITDLVTNHLRSKT